MIPTYTAAQLRAAEAVALAATGDRVLMRRAARAVAQRVLTGLPSPRPGRRVALLVGAGNNGGDALFSGVALRRWGIAVTAILATPNRVHTAGLAALRRAGGRVLDATSEGAAVTDALARADVILDGIVGLGSRPGLRDPWGRWVEAASQAGARQIAIDLPSGIDPDTGASDGPAFRADTTVAIGGIATGLLLADDLAGDIRLAAIGMDPAQLAPEAGCDAMVPTDADLVSLPQPGAADNKYSGGVVGIVAGSDRYPGAGLLCVGGAVRTRPGLVRYVGEAFGDIVRAHPEVVGHADVAEAGRVQAWVVGPGIGTDGPAMARLRDVLASSEPVLVDADGLTLLAGAPGLIADRRRRGATTVLTPHAGEFARLFSDIDQTRRLEAARAAAARSGAIVLLKGHRTVLADPRGRAAIVASGSPWLASAGSGDVLSGIAGSLLATGMEPLRAAATAAHVHGRAGELAQRIGTAGASALLDALPRVLADCGSIGT